MKIAIVGGGFSGLAVAWNLLGNQSTHIDLTIFDTHIIGNSTSGIAAGLLHPYAGAHAKLNHLGLEGLAATKKLLEVSSKALGKSVIQNSRGILRLALSDQQKMDFFNSPARHDPTVSWLNEAQTAQLCPAAAIAPALWLKEGLIIDCKMYLQGLWIACKNKGAKWIVDTVESLEALQDYDLIILSTGANKTLSPDTPITYVKGQILEMTCEDLKLEFALNSQAYIIPKTQSGTILLGATFEKSFGDLTVDADLAYSLLIDKAERLMPGIKKGRLIKGFSGSRAVTPNHLPLIKQLNNKTYLITGMGSKGLLYHALYAEKLDSIIKKMLF